jgi:hypothetical protein
VAVFWFAWIGPRLFLNLQGCDKVLRNTDRLKKKKPNKKKKKKRENTVCTGDLHGFTVYNA